MATEIEDKIFN